MSTLIKHEGVWKEPKTIYVKDQGVWKDPEMLYVKDQGIWKEVGGIPSFGGPFKGGFYFGNITVGSDEYVLIIADKSAEAELQWKTYNTGTSGTASAVDGWANTNAINNTTHPAAKYCRDYRGGGFDDWYLPARDELNQMWLNLPPNGGATPAPFKTGGAQAMAAEFYWTSTQSSPSQSWMQGFNNGVRGYQDKTTPLLVRPVRRVNIYDL